MNPIVAAVLPLLIDMAEKLVQAEGPSALAFLQSELNKLHSKYNPPPK